MKNLNFINRFILVLNILASVGIILSYLSIWISPVDFWILAFAGLGYPLLLLINLLFICYWAILRNRRFIVSLVAILIGLNQLLSFIQFNSTPLAVDESRTQLKVMSYNVRLFDLYNWSEESSARDSIFRLLQAQDPDILCFQEFYHQPKPSKFVTRDTLVQLLRANYVSEEYTHHLKNNQHFGISTYSTYPIVQNGVIRFENDANNLCIWTDLKLNSGDTIRVYNAHLASIRFKPEDYRFVDELGEDREVEGLVWDGGMGLVTRLKAAFIKRASQAEQIAAHALECPHPIILAGDFNDTPLSYCYGKFSDFLDDAFVESGNGIGNSYVGIFPSFRIDYIMYSQPFEAIAFQTLSEKYSDHYPIVTTLTFPASISKD